MCIIIIIYLFYGNIFINYCLILFGIKIFLDIFSFFFVFNIKLEEKKELFWYFILIDDFIVKVKDI